MHVLDVCVARTLSRAEKGLDRCQQHAKGAWVVCVGVVEAMFKKKQDGAGMTCLCLSHSITYSYSYRTRRAELYCTVFRQAAADHAAPSRSSDFRCFQSCPVTASKLALNFDVGSSQVRAYFLIPSSSPRTTLLQDVRHFQKAVLTLFPSRFWP